jgi:hypothetical protein
MPNTKKVSLRPLRPWFSSAAPLQRGPYGHRYYIATHSNCFFKNADAPEGVRENHAFNRRGTLPMPRNDPEFCFLEILAGISNTMGRVFFFFLISFIVFCK